MRIGGGFIWLRRATAALAAIGGVWVAMAHSPAISAEPRSEVRALWVLRTSLSTPASIHALVKTASDHGFNTLLVQVRGRGDAYYTSDLEPRAAELVRQPAAFDPLASLLAEAHKSGVRVHAWVSLN